MTTKLNIANLIFQLLPAHKRQPKRLGLLRAFMSPLIALYNTFSGWREDTRVLFNVASQVTILEGYLRKKYNSASISIETSESGAVRVGLEAEGVLHRLTMGLLVEGVKVNVPLIGELDATIGGVDFVVYVPYGVDIEHVRADIERFRQALITYRIRRGDGYMASADQQNRQLLDSQGRELLIFKKVINTWKE